MPHKITEFRAIAALAKWKMLRDFKLSVGGDDLIWVQDWVNKLRAFVASLGRDPEEVVIETLAVANPMETDELPQKPGDGRANMSRLIKSFKKKPLRICCEGTQTGAFSVLASLAADHSLNLDINASFPTGKAISRVLESDDPPHFDFIVMTLAPTALEAASKFAMNYRVLRVLHKEEQAFLQKRQRAIKGKTRSTPEAVDPKPNDPPLLYLVRNTSAHASVLGEKRRHRYLDNVAQLINTAISLPEDAQVAVWEPVAAWLLSKPHYRLMEVGSRILHPIALFCNREFDRTESQRGTREDFNDIVWRQWSRFQNTPEQGWAHVVRNMPEGFCKQFGDHFTPQEFIDFEEYRRPSRRILHEDCVKILRLLEERGTYLQVQQMTGYRGLPTSHSTIEIRLEPLVRCGFLHRKSRKGGYAITDEGREFLASRNG